MPISIQTEKLISLVCNIIVFSFRKFVKNVVVPDQHTYILDYVMLFTYTGKSILVQKGFFIPENATETMHKRLPNYFTIRHLAIETFCGMYKNI